MKKLKFGTIDELIETMYEVAYKGELVTVVSNEDMATSLVKELLSDDNDLKIDYININTYDYDCEYNVTISFDEITKDFHLYVEKCINEDTGKPYATDGYVLFSDDVCEGIVDSMISNECSDFDFDMFSIGKMKESCLIYRDGYGNINGFTKTWIDDIGTSTYSFHSDNVDMVKDIAAGFGIDL